MRQVHRAGEKLFIEYAGLTLPAVDPATGEVRRAHIVDHSTRVPSRYERSALRTWTYHYLFRITKRPGLTPGQGPQQPALGHGSHG